MSGTTCLAHPPGAAAGAGPAKATRVRAPQRAAAMMTALRWAQRPAEEGVPGASSQPGGGLREPAEGAERSSDADWTANDDWLDALGLGWGPSRTEETSPAPDPLAAGDSAAAESGRDSAPGYPGQAGPGDLTLGSAGERGGGPHGGRSTSFSSNSGGGGDDWFFDGTAGGRAAVVADPARVREGTEQKSDRRKAANSSAGGWGSQRGRGRDGGGGLARR